MCLLGEGGVCDAWPTPDTISYDEGTGKEEEGVDSAGVEGRSCRGVSCREVSCCEVSCCEVSKLTWHPLANQATVQKVVMVQECSVFGW